MGDAAWLRKIVVPAFMLACVAVSTAQAPPTDPAADTPAVKPAVSEDPRPWINHELPDPNDPRLQEYRQQQKDRAQIEKELRKIRGRYFRHVRNVEIRQIGIHKLRQYTEPAFYPALLEVFKRDDDDVRLAILDHLADRKAREADITLAWVSVYDKDENIRQAAAKRLAPHVEKSEQVDAGIMRVVAQGLRSHKEDELAGAANLTQVLKLYEAIPLLINAQLGGRQGGSGSGKKGDLGWIFVGTQQAYVSDLTPVVSDSAVGFDPQLSVVTDGTVLRVMGASVVEYHYAVHNALVGLSSAAWGRSTKGLGWDQDAWRNWYADEFLPYMEEKELAGVEKAVQDAGAGGG
jgi:hypothetical protein